LTAAHGPRRPGLWAWPLPALALACGSELEVERPADVVAAQSPAVANVVTVSWRTSEPTVGYVEYGATGAMEWSTPFEATPTREHSMTLLGLTPDTQYSYRVITWGDHNAGASDVLSLRTGTLPADIPRFTLRGSGFDSYVVVPVRGSKPAVVIVDPNGAVVWYHQDDSGLDVIRARVALDGRSVLYNRTSLAPESAQNSALVRAPLDGSAVTVLPVPFLGADFVELEGGAVAALVVDRRNDAAGNSVRGDAIVQVAASGAVTPIWSTWDAFDPATDQGDIPNTWTNANSLAYNPLDGSYYVGLQSFSSVLKVVPATSVEPDWVLGTTAATLSFAPGLTPFFHQSGIYRFGNNGIVLIDNDGASSSVVEYSLDFTKAQAVEFGRFSVSPPLQVGELGGVVRTQRGNWIVSWGAAGRIDYVFAETVPPEAIWGLSVVGGGNLGYHDIATSLYVGSAKSPLR
jgi:hypothetical protein